MRKKRRAINRIKSRIKLSEYIASELKHQGRRTQNIAMFHCPFHRHNAAELSLAVDDNEGLWYCSVCRAGGDIIDFVKRFHRLSEEEALEKLIRFERSSGSKGGIYRMKTKVMKFLGVVLIAMVFLTIIIFGFGNIGGCGHNKKTWSDVVKISKQLDEKGRKLAEVLKKK